MFKNRLGFLKEYSSSKSLLRRLYSRYKYSMTDNNNTIITIIIINYNSGQYLADCLVALTHQTFKNFNVIIADNNSDDGSFDVAKHFLKTGGDRCDSKFQFVNLEENVGFAKGNNFLVSRVRTPLVALLNPDAIPDPEWLEQLVEAADNNLDTAMFGSTQIRLNDYARYDGVGDNYLAIGVPWRGGYGHPTCNIQDIYEVFSPCAASAVYRTEIFRSAGGFDESYFCYVEDVDLGFRLRLSGHKCLQVAKAVVRHAGGASSPDTRFAIFHGTRNMIWTFVKNMPGPFFYPLLPAHLCLLMILTARAIFRGDAMPTISGILASVKGLPRCWSLRCNIQSSRTAALRAIARAICWFPWYYLQRAPFSLGRKSSPLL